MKNEEGKLEKEKEENIPKRKHIFLQRRKRLKIFGVGKYLFSRGYFAETLKEVSTDLIVIFEDVFIWSQGLKVSRS